MDFKQEITALMHRFYRNDEFLIDFYISIQKLIDKVVTVIVRLENILHFNRLDDETCEWWEKLLNYTNTSTLEVRKSMIRLKWLRDSSNSLKLIKNICNSFGDIDVSFPSESKHIQLMFKNTKTIPDYLDTLLSQIDEVKPAHIAIEYITDDVLLIQDIHEVLTVEQMEQYNVRNYCSGKKE